MGAEMSDYEYINFEDIPSVQKWVKFKPLFYDKEDNIYKNCKGGIMWLNLDYCISIYEKYHHSIENSYGITTATESYGGRFVK